MGSLRRRRASCPRTRPRGAGVPLPPCRGGQRSERGTTTCPTAAGRAGSGQRAAPPAAGPPPLRPAPGAVRAVFTNMGGAAGPGRAASAKGRESAGQRWDGRRVLPCPAPRKCPPGRDGGTVPGGRAGRGGRRGWRWRWLRGGAAGGGASPVRGRGVPGQAVKKPCPVSGGRRPQPAIFPRFQLIRLGVFWTPPLVKNRF